MFPCAQAVVLHDLSVHEASSSFPISLGTRITGVDDHTFSSTGESFSMIVLPNSNTANEKKLQADDVSLAYEVRASPAQSHAQSLLTTLVFCTQFAKKFPGYTADNLAESTQLHTNQALQTDLPLFC